MSLLTDKLSALQPGSHVRFSHVSGQTVDGIVAENDGKESLSVQVTLITTLRYDQITLMDEYTGASMPLQAFDPDEYSVPENIEIMTVSCEKEDVALSFKAMLSEEKKLLQPAFDKYQSYLKSHEDEKCNEALDLVWQTMGEKGWFYNNSRVNIFYARMLLSHGDYLDAADSLFYAGSVRAAYCSLYHAAAAAEEDYEYDEDEDENGRDPWHIELYRLGAAISAIALTDPDYPNKEEAAEVLRVSSLKTSDISAVEYVYGHEPAKPVRRLLNGIVRSIASEYINDPGGIRDTDRLIDKLKDHLHVNLALKEIKKLLEKLPGNKEVIKVPESEPVPLPDPVPEHGVKTYDQSAIYEGKIVSLKILDNKGVIESADGDRFNFKFRDIADTNLLNRLRKLDPKTFSPIAVKYMVLRYAGEYIAVSVKSGYEAPKIVHGSMSEASYFHKQKNYTAAINAYRNHLDASDPDASNAFTEIISCYLALSNESGEMGYIEELNAFVKKYSSLIERNSKTLEVLQQYYMKVQNYSEAVKALNDLMELCSPGEYGRLLHYLTNKERCYRALEDYQSAISQLRDWLDIVKRNKLKDRYTARDTHIYAELAELYYEYGDYEEAEKYTGMCSESERKQAMTEKLAARKAELAESEDMSDEEDITENDGESDKPDPFPEETLRSAYDSYEDSAGFDSLGITDEDVIAKALGFDMDKSFCLLTYLNAAARISADSDVKRISADGTEIYAANALRALDSAFAFAFNSPLSEKVPDSAGLISVFEETAPLIPGINPLLFASAAVYTLFGDPADVDYGIRELADTAAASLDGAEKFPSLPLLIEDLVSFRETTGLGMDVFAEYKTKGAAADKIINEASECRRQIDEKSRLPEQYVQYRQTRESMFIDPQSDIRRCLDIVCENRIAEYKFVRDTMRELFIRSGAAVSAENVDKNRIKKYIDTKYEEANDEIRSTGYHITKQFKSLIGTRANALMNTTVKVVSCICDWVSLTEHSGAMDNAYAKSQYEKLLPQVKNELLGIIDSCAAAVSENGQKWGIKALRTAASELLSKIGGSYSGKQRKYFFMDFLRGEDVLLDDSGMPELVSTFCGMDDFNILSRIERHADEPHPSFAERLTQILSNDESKHNFRSARLIRDYGADMGITEINECRELAQYNECLKQAKQRFENMYFDFADQLELYESYGTLSNIDGEKDEFKSLARAWFRITRITGDYGFYVRLLEKMRGIISKKAEKKGEQLMRMLEELASKPEYDFGVFDIETIRSQIIDQNYSAAEFIMSCILRHDIKAVTDYSAEPFGYFAEFINEHATNYRAVRSAGKNISDAITEYSGKKDMEVALLYLTNNARKETRGGANLIRSWIRAGYANTDMSKLLTRLGFDPVSISPDQQTVNAEAYNVFCRKQSGKVNYVHQIPAFGSKSSTEGFRVLCLYGKYDCDSLMDKFRSVNTVAKNTLVLLDFALNMEERRRLARKIKEEKSFSRTFIVIDRVILFWLAKHYAENTVIKRLMAVTLPFAYYQPFVESSNQDMPPELFTGREAELTKIESPDGANLVYGGRQLGKSALLKMARRNIDRNGNGGRAVLVDIKDRSASEAAAIVSGELIIEGILDESTRCDNWTDLSGHIKKRLMDEDPATRIDYLLLMLDEADEFIKTSMDDADSPITALKKLSSDRFKLVMAGLHNLSRYNREMMHGNSTLIHLKPLVIKQFRREEATKLLTNISAYLGFRFNQNIIDNILASTYNYPGLIQFYCQKLIEAMKDDDYAGYSESRTPNYEVTESHYKKVLSDADFTELVNEKLEATLFTEEKGRSNYHIIALIIAFLYYTSPNEKGYTSEDLLRVAEDYHITRVTSLKPEQLSEILNEMWDLNVITVMDGFYRFATDGFRKLLGTREKVENRMSEYFDEGETE